jgi:hypothetical protein
MSGFNRSSNRVQDHSNSKSHHSGDFDEVPIVDDEGSKNLNKVSSKSLKKRVQSASGVRDKVPDDRG